MCEHTQPERQLLRLFEDWLLVASPDTLHDLNRHLADSGSATTAVDVVNMLASLNVDMSGECR